MKMIKMSYKGFVFYANPSSIKIQFSKHFSKRNVPFFSAKTQEICFKPTRISGNGIFSSSNARDYAHRLTRIFNSQGSAYLFLPNSEPVMVYFESLDISYDSEKNCVSYSFSFVEDCNNKKDKFNFGFTYARSGENLYDIANRTDLSVERLFELNSYKDLFSVNEGDKVMLC